MPGPNIYQRLLKVQSAIRAPRQEGGRFAGGSRSAEQILAAAKPAGLEHGVLIYTDDAIEVIEGRRYLVVTAHAVNVDEPDQRVAVEAYAWEGEQEKGLDTSQVTGKTSSYAKKYALQNLLSIDDTKDADNEPQRPKVEAETNGKVPEGWESHEQAKAAHDTLWEKMQAVPPDRRGPIREFRDTHGWPLARDDYDELVDLVLQASADEGASAANAMPSVAGKADTAGQAATSPPVSAPKSAGEKVAQRAHGLRLPDDWLADLIKGTIGKPKAPEKLTSEEAKRVDQAITDFAAASEATGQ